MERYEIEKILLELTKEEIIPQNSHGINQMNIEKFLITPFEKYFFNPIERSIEKHWIVFDEDINNALSGYLIFYSEIDQAFGLGSKTNLNGLEDTGTFIGIYGSFADTIKSM